jgi:hypothetical protein
MRIFENFPNVYLITNTNTIQILYWHKHNNIRKQKPKWMDKDCLMLRKEVRNLGDIHITTNYGMPFQMQEKTITN